MTRDNANSLTFEGHLHLGERLKKVYQELNSIGALLADTYDIGSKLHRQAIEAHEEVLALLSALDDQLEEDCPDRTHYDLNKPYIGWRMHSRPHLRVFDGGVK